MNNCRSPLFALLICLIASTIAGCDGANVVHGRSTKTFVLEDGDFAMIAHAAIDLIDHQRSIDRIVVANNVDPRVRAAVAAQRKLVSENSLPKGVSIPRNYFHLRSFTIDDGDALFEGDISTDAEDAMPKGSVDCGMIFSVRFSIVGNDWHSDSYKLTDCTKERVWYPKDS